jgi:hypothetical protein
VLREDEIVLRVLALALEQEEPALGDTANSIAKELHEHADSTHLGTPSAAGARHDVEEHDEHHPERNSALARRAPPEHVETSRSRLSIIAQQPEEGLDHVPFPFIFPIPWLTDL